MNPIFLAIIAALFFGASAPVGKILLHQLTAFQLAGLLYFGAAIGVSLVLIVRRESPGLGRRIGKQNSLRLTFAIFFGGMLAPLFLMKGLQLASAGSVSLWLVLEMMFTALLGHFFFKDHLGKFGWMGAAGCLVATVFLSMGAGAAGFRAGAWVALACLCWGFDNHFTALIDGLKPLQSTFWKGLVAGTVNLSIGFYHAPLPDGKFILWGLIAGAFCYGMSIALLARSSQSLGAVRSQMIFASAPFFGLLFSFLLLKESFAWSQGAASLLFIASLFLLFCDRHAHSHEHEAMDHVHAHRHDDGHHDHSHSGQPASLHHSHPHHHEPMVHSHPHWPDLHHRHEHQGA